MGHYDSCYEAEADARIAVEQKRAEDQLTEMTAFWQTIHRNIGTRGISQRHLDAFQDMLNETKLRVQQ